MMGGMTGSFIIIDLSQMPPVIVDADQVLPALMASALADINRKLDTIMTAESSYQSDVATLQAFFTDLQTQLGNIKSQVAAGVTDTTALDQLAAQAASLQPAVDNMATSSVPGGAPAPAAPAAPVDPNAPPVDTSAPVDPNAPPPAGP